MLANTRSRSSSPSTSATATSVAPTVGRSVGEGEKPPEGLPQ